MRVRAGRILGVVLAAALIGTAPAGAADLLDGAVGPPVLGDIGLGGPAPPRYFPRSDGSEHAVRRRAPAPLALGCVPRRASVPTNALDDPSYVGSAYGLSRPSYYGLTPPPGIDDPFGRPLLPYCP